MRNASCPLFSLGIPLLTLPAQLTPYTPPASSWTVPWPTGSTPTAPIKRVAWAQATGMRVPDLVAGSTDFMLCATSPHTRTEMFSLTPASGAKARDFACTRDPATGKDVAVCLTPAGLVVRKLAAGIVIETVLNANAAWASAQRLRTGTFDSDAVVDVVAVDASGRNLLFGLSSNGYEPTAVGGEGNVLDFVSVAWDAAAGPDEVGVLSTTGIAVVGATGQVFAEASFAVTAGAVARLPGTPVDRLAAAFDVPVGGQTASLLYLFRGTVPGFAEMVIDLGTRRPRTMTAGEIDGDGNADLVLGYANLARLDVFINQTVLRPGTPLFADDSLGGFAVDLAAMAPVTGAQPAVADFDADGDGDIGFARQSGGLTVIENVHVFNVARPEVTAIASTEVTSYIDINVLTPEPTEASHVEVRVWRLELVAGHVVIGRTELNAPIQVVVAARNQIRIPLAYADILNGGFFCTAQYISFNPDGGVRPRSPAALFRIVVLDAPNSSLLQALTGLPVREPTVHTLLDGGYQSAVNPIPTPPPPPPAGTTPPG